MVSHCKAFVFFVVSVWLAEKISRSHGHSLLQRSSPRSESNCVLTRRELRRFSDGEEGRWLLTDSGFESLEGDIQRLVNCTEDGDVLLFEVEAPIQPRRRIVIPWNLTLSAFVEDSRMRNGTFPEARRKTTILCPRQDEGVFLVEAQESLLANFVFLNCSLSSKSDEEPYGIITTASCGTSQDMSTIGFYHLQFEANFLNKSAALCVQEQSCSRIQIISITFQNNLCVGICAANLVGRPILQSITLTRNRISEGSVEAPRLIGIHSGSNTTVDGLIASENNGTVIHVQDANLTLSKSLIFENSAPASQSYYDGAGVTLLNSTGQILDCRFEGNTGDTGSSIAVHNSSSVTIRRTSITANNARSEGGGVSITHSSTVRILDSFIANNSAAFNGGGVFSSDVTDFHIEDTTFARNSASFGGGMFGTRLTFASVVSCRFDQNSVSDSGGGAYFESGNYTLEDCTFEENRSNMNGGGFSCFHSTLNVNDTRFLRNSASANGGGSSVFGNSSSWFANCTWTANVALRNGGGSLFEYGPIATVTGSVFSSNQAEFGAGAHGTEANLTLLDVSGNNNIASESGGVLHLIRSNGMVSDCTFARNRASDGGAVSAYESEAFVFISTFVSNIAVLRGGAVRGIESSNLTIDDCRFDSNSATVSGGSTFVSESVVYATNLRFQNNTAKYGGALGSYDSTSEVLRSRFVSNKVVRDGGAIDSEGSGDLSIEDCSFVSNSADRDGGAIIATESIVSASNLQFQNNNALRFGGAVFLQSTTSAIFSHSVFHSESSGHHGGGLSATGTVLRLRNISITSCAAVRGGGVYLERTSANIKRISVTFCEASESGGGILMIESNTSSRVLNISLNRAAGTSRFRSVGGGIAVERSSALFVRNATLDGNQAQRGAGICSFDESVVFVSDGYFYNNSARTSGGAGYFYSSSVTMERVLCQRNSAFFGGSVYVANSSMNLNGSQLITSSSIHDGGSILAHANSTLVMEATTIQSSRAVNGGGIMLIGSYFRGSGVQFRDCLAKEHGGGVGLNESSSFVCTDCLFEGNSAWREGGAIRLEPETFQLLPFQLANTVFVNNSADFGGGIHFQSGNGSINCSEVNSTECTFLVLTGCVFTSNHARFGGGAILANNPNAVQIVFHPFNSTDSFASLRHEAFETLDKVLSSNAACGNWTENTATIYGPIVATYARRVSMTIVHEQNTAEEVSGNGYVLYGHQSGHPLPTISLEAVDEFSQTPALIQGNQHLEAVMTSVDGLFMGNVVSRMQLGRGNFLGITPFREPGNYTIHIEFSESSVPTLIIGVEIRPCVIGESRAANGTLCEPCSADTYNFHLLRKEGNCSQCPDDARCDSRAIRPKKGFWHQTPCSTHVQRCLSERACDEEGRGTRLLELGSHIEDCNFDEEFVSNYSDALCREGYTGPLCGSCKASHGKTRSFRCEECYERFVSVCLVVLAASVLLGLSAFTIRSALPAHIHPGDRSQPLRQESASSLPVNFQMVEMWCTGIVPPEVIHPNLRTQRNGANTAAVQQRNQRNAELAKWKAVEIFKITINYLQVIAIAVAVNVAWTGALIAMFETAEFIGVVTSEAAGRSTDCMTSTDSLIPRSAVTTIVNLIIPALVAAVFVVFWTVAMIKNKKGYGYLAKRCFLSVVVVNYLSYISVTRTAVNTLYCVDVHDSVNSDHDSTTKYWAVDTALKCYDGSHTVLASVCGWPVLGLFTLGFPVIIAYVLITKRNQDGIDSPWLFETAGCLYRSYDQRFIFWESCILLRKATLAVIVVFAYPLGGNVQGLLAVCVLVIALYGHLLCSPYRSEFDTLNRLEGLSLLISSLTFVSGLFLNDDRSTTETRAAITALVVLANVGLFVYFSLRFFVAGATYLGIILEREGVSYDESATAFQVVKTFMKSRLSLRVDSAIRRFHALTSRHDEEPCTSQVETELTALH